MTIQCRICKSNCYEDYLLNYSNMPTSAQGFLTTEELEFDAGSDLEVIQCSSCGLVQLENEPVSYYKEVIRSSAFSEEMNKFRLKQFKLWVKKYQLNGKKILEVGCGKGEYLKILSNSGVIAFGVEHSKESVQSCHQDNLTVTQGFFGETKPSFSGQMFDGFICLSFMEHWPDPGKVFESLNENLRDGAIGLVEVPNFDMILKDGLYSEFISDHLMYFTNETFTFMMQLNGFEVLSCEPIWHNYILSAVVKKRVKTNLDFFDDFRIIVKKDIDEFIEKFPKRKVAIWGAGHQALATISLTKIQKKIKYIVDSAIFKQGKYSPSSHILIVSEESLIKNPVDAVIIMAGSYSNEIQKILKNKYPQIKVSILREYGLEIINYD